MNGELNPFEEEAMSLSPRDKETLNRNIMRIAKIILELENSMVDPRALDLLEIAGSLLEQQVEMDIVFEQVFNEQDNTTIGDQGDCFTTDENTPSAEDLENWFNGG